MSFYDRGSFPREYTKKFKVGLSLCCRGTLCIVHTPGGFPAASVGRQQFRRLQPRVTLPCSCGSALYGMRFRNDGRSTRPAPAQPRFPVPRGEWCGVQHGMSWCSFLDFRHSRHGHPEPAASSTFPTAEPDLQLASRRILYPYPCGWLAGLACQFPTRAAHGQAR